MLNWFRFVAIEFLRFVGLCVLIALVASVMANMVAGSTTAGFFRQIHMDRDGAPIWDQFLYACKVSLPILAIAGMLLATGAVVVGALCEMPGMGWVRIVCLALSAMPSFLLPFLPYLLQPSLPFSGLADGGIMIPAVCLALGDCNLSTVASQFRESLRHQRNQPHIQTLEAIGRPAWLEVWPRASITLISSLVGRTPHLIGGLVALELLFNINGIGIAAYRAVMVTPADLHWLLWVCLLCVCIRTSLRLFELAARGILMPETFSCERQERSSSDDVAFDDDAHPEVVAFQSGDESSVELLEHREDWLPALPARISSISIWSRIRRNLLYYLRVRPYHWVNVGIAATFVLAFVAALVGCYLYGNVEAGGSFEDPDSNHWFGTDLAGIDIVSSIRKGIGQLVIPGIVAMLAGLIAIPAALLGLHQWLPTGRLQRCVSWADAICLYLAEFVESLPKLLVLLAAYSVISGSVVTGNWLGVSVTVNSMVVRLFAVIGFLHAPQVYRAVREELAALNNSVYIEASLLARVQWHQMLLITILRNHCLHVILIQAAVIAAGVLHYDAVLGLFGVRGRGVIFTWGSTLGMAVESYMQYGPLPWFNAWILGTPLLVVWLGILSFWLVAEAVKIVWSGYVYRLR